MMNAYFMLMIGASFTGFTHQKQQNLMQKVKGNPSWLLTLFQPIMAFCPLLKELNPHALRSSLARIGMATLAMTTYSCKYSMQLTWSTSSIQMTITHSSLTMPAHIQNVQRMPFLHTTCLRAHQSPGPTGW